MIARVPRHGHRLKLRIGLLGGSFNPAHAGHRHIARAALHRLRLDQVWLLVSPGNPLKPRADMAKLPERLAGARRIADARRILATDIERHFRSAYTEQTLRELRRRFPRVRFVWLMGADNLLQLPRWRHWRRIVRQMPFAVFPRPAYTRMARASPAARRLRQWQRPARQAAALADMQPPAWILLDMREDPHSATAIRREAVPGAVS